MEEDINAEESIETMDPETEKKTNAAIKDIKTALATLRIASFGCFPLFFPGLYFYFKIRKNPLIPHDIKSKLTNRLLISFCEMVLIIGVIIVIVVLDVI